MRSPTAWVLELRDGNHPLREIYDSGGALAGGLVFSLFSTLFGVLGLVIFSSENGPPEALFGSTFFLIMGLLLIWPLMLRAFTIGAPVIAMDVVGLFDKRVSDQLFRWDDILSIRPSRFLGMTFGVLLELPIGVVTPRTFAFTPRQRAIARVKRWFGARSVTLFITASCTEVDGTQLYDWCLAYSRIHKFEVEKQDV